MVEERGTRWPSIVHWNVRNCPGLAQSSLSSGTWKRSVLVSCVCCSVRDSRRCIGLFELSWLFNGAPRTGVSAIRDDSTEACGCFHFLNTKAHWTRHTATTEPAAILSPKLPGCDERRSSKRAGMDTSANEIMKTAIPSAFSDEWLCL